MIFWELMTMMMMLGSNTGFETSFESGKGEWIAQCVGKLIELQFKIEYPSKREEYGMDEDDVNHVSHYQKQSAFSNKKSEMEPRL